MYNESIKFTYSPLGKAFEKKPKPIEEQRTIAEGKQLKNVENN